MSTESSQPEQMSHPLSSETRRNTIHFHFIASLDVPRTRKQSAVLLRPFKHWIQYDAATAKAVDVHHPRKYVQLRVGRAILAVQGERRDSCVRSRRGSAVGVRCSDQAPSMNVRPPLSKLGRTPRRRRLRQLDWIIACVAARLENICK